MRTRRDIPTKWRKVIRSIPGYDPLADAGDCCFDPGAAENAIGFFRDCLHHVKGECAGEPLILEPWQAAIVANLFGWKRPDGTRRYREAFIFIPRKNGKTTLVAGFILYVLLCDGEPGAEIYGAAAEYKQATLVFDQARGMVMQDSDLSARARVYNGQTSKAITTADGLSAYRVLSSEAYSKHGYNVHLAVVDELHALADGELVDVLSTGMGSRRQPLLIHITTSDFEREGSICNEKHDYACKVRDGLIRSPEFLPVIYEASRDDDWTDEGTWRKANPNLGVSLSLEYLRSECQRAQDVPRFENEFKRLHLNIRTEQATRWITVDSWDACAGEISAASLAGRPCFAGLDLASTSDITAMELLFPRDGGAFDLLSYFWVPEDQVNRRSRNNQVMYADWARRGYLRVTEGNMTDYAVVRRDINELANQFGIQEIAVDRLFQGAQLAMELQKDGLEVIAFPQSFIGMAAPASAFERLILGGDLVHDGNPVMRWMVSNVSVKTDENGNMKPDKKRSSDKIDGVVAAIMALGRATATPAKKPSIYETQELVWL